MLLGFLLMSDKAYAVESETGIVASETGIVTSETRADTSDARKPIGVTTRLASIDSRPASIKVQKFRQFLEKKMPKLRKFQKMSGDTITHDDLGRISLTLGHTTEQSRALYDKNGKMDLHEEYAIEIVAKKLLEESNFLKDKNQNHIGAKVKQNGNIERKQSSRQQIGSKIQYVIVFADKRENTKPFEIPIFDQVLTKLTENGENILISREYSERRLKIQDVVKFVSRVIGLTFRKIHILDASSVPRIEYRYVTHSDNGDSQADGEKLVALPDIFDLLKMQQRLDAIKEIEKLVDHSESTNVPPSKKKLGTVPRKSNHPTDSSKPILHKPMYYMDVNPFIETPGISTPERRPMVSFRENGEDEYCVQIPIRKVSTLVGMNKTDKKFLSTEAHNIQVDSSAAGRSAAGRNFVKHFLKTYNLTYDKMLDGIHPIIRTEQEYGKSLLSEMWLLLNTVEENSKLSLSALHIKSLISKRMTKLEESSANHLGKGDEITSETDYAHGTTIKFRLENENPFDLVIPESGGEMYIKTWEVDYNCVGLGKKASEEKIALDMTIEKFLSDVVAQSQKPANHVKQIDTITAGVSDTAFAISNDNFDERASATQISASGSKDPTATSETAAPSQSTAPSEAAASSQSAAPSQTTVRPLMTFSSVVEKV